MGVTLSPSLPTINMKTLVILCMLVCLSLQGVVRRDAEADPHRRRYNSYNSYNPYGSYNSGYNNGYNAGYNSGYNNNYRPNNGVNLGGLVPLGAAFLKGKLIGAALAG